MQVANEGSVNMLTIQNYMSVTKDCGTNQTLPACAMTCPSAWGCNFKPTSWTIFVTSNGMQWGDFNGDKWCAVDVNGVKPPNQLKRCILITE